MEECQHQFQQFTDSENNTSWVCRFCDFDTIDPPMPNLGNVIDIQFYRFETLPAPLVEEAETQGFIDRNALFAVKTIIEDGPPFYQFDHVGNSADEINQYMHHLARQDGFDLNEVMKSAFPQ